MISRTLVTGLKYLLGLCLASVSLTLYAQQTVYLTHSEWGEAQFSDQASPRAREIVLSAVPSAPTDSQAQIDSMLQVADALQAARLLRESQRHQARQQKAQQRRQAQQTLADENLRQQSYERQHGIWLPYSRHPHAYSQPSHRHHRASGRQPDSSSQPRRRQFSARLQWPD